MRTESIIVDQLIIDLLNYKAGTKFPRESWNKTNRWGEGNISLVLLPFTSNVTDNVTAVIELLRTRPEAEVGLSCLRIHFRANPWEGSYQISHVFLCILVYWCVFLCILMHYCVFLCILVHSCALLCILVHYCALLCIIVYSCLPCLSPDEDEEESTAAFPRTFISTISPGRQNTKANVFFVMGCVSSSSKS